MGQEEAGRVQRRKELGAGEAKESTLLFFVIVRLVGGQGGQKTPSASRGGLCIKSLYEFCKEKKKKKIKGSFDPLQRENQRTSKQNNNLLHFPLL